jgi:hypothetical protein
MATIKERKKKKKKRSEALLNVIPHTHTQRHVGSLGGD